MEEKKKTGNVYKVIMLVVLSIFITFLLTSLGIYQYFTNLGLGKISVSSISKNTDIASALGEYKSIIDKTFLGEVDEEKLKEGAIKGYIEGLNDPYTEYISKDEMEDYMESALGNFVGIGIYMVNDTETNKIKVLAPIKESPAEKAGIQAGDLILSIDGVEYSGDQMTVASSRIKGKENSTVKLEILRGQETKTFEIERELIIENPVEGEVLEGNIGYIMFNSFDEGTADGFKAKYEELEKQGIKSLIIDLRYNGGGIVDEALKIADYVLEKDKVMLYEVDKNDNEDVKKSENDPIINLPIIILTSENTASSSEILSAALKENGKAKTVGTTTYGKGIIQTLMQLPDGSGLKITSAEYLTPNRNKINKIGIKPDEEVELPETVKNTINIDKAEDTQLQKAIEMAK